MLSHERPYRDRNATPGSLVRTGWPPRDTAVGYDGGLTTFEEVSRVIKKEDAIRLRHALDEGLDSNLSNDLNSTILMLAAMKGNTAIGRLLIDKSADVNVRINCTTMRSH